MIITIDMPRRYALRWLAGWYAVAILKSEDHAENYDTRKGIEALAALVPAATPNAESLDFRGRPKGTGAVGGLPIPASDGARAPLRNLAAVLGVATPQAAVRAVADEILAAAPHVELDCSGAENFEAIERIVTRLRERCVRGAA